MELLIDTISYFIGFSIMGAALVILLAGEEAKSAVRERQLNGEVDYNGNKIEEE